MKAVKYKNISIQIEADLLEKIDERAQCEDLNRSQLFRRLARKDLDEHPLPDKQLELAKAAA